jgi:hypothetical protein
MKIRLPHAPYIANKIALDLLNSGFVTLLEGVEIVVELADSMLEDDIKKEMALEQRVEEILQENETDIEFMQVDRRQMFWLIKKKLAPEYGFILSYEDRYSDLAHKMLDIFVNESLIDYSVSENRVKNVIYSAIEGYLKSFEDIEDVVISKIDGYKRKLIPGSEEYDMVFQKLYEEELRKKGMLQ